jgi:hypothetical protein
VFPFESAAILSLAGVNCIVANQWNCKLRDNKEKFVKIFEGTLDYSVSIALIWKAFKIPNLGKIVFISLFSGVLDNNKSIGNALRSFVCGKTESNSQEDSPPQTTEVSTTQSNALVSGNTVLYGVPYFLLNPLKA